MPKFSTELPGDPLSTLLKAVDYVDGTTQEGATATTVQTTGSGTYVKLKELTAVPRSGTLSVRWDMQQILGAPGIGRAKVYLSGVATGVEQTVNAGAGYITKTDTGITVAAGDLIQIYGKSDGGSGDLYIKNLLILCDNPIDAPANTLIGTLVSSVTETL